MSYALRLKETEEQFCEILSARSTWILALAGIHTRVDLLRQYNAGERLLRRKLESISGCGKESILEIFGACNDFDPYKKIDEEASAVSLLLSKGYMLINKAGWLIKDITTD